MSATRARARRLPPGMALALEAFTWFLPPVAVLALNLYSGVAGTGGVLLAAALAALIFIPWTFRARFRGSKEEQDPADAGMRTARLRGKLLFGLLQILWASLLLPLSPPLWLWAVLLVLAFPAVPALAGARAVNIAPGVLVFLGVMIALLTGVAPAAKASGGAWTLLTGAPVMSTLDHAAGLGLALILLPVLIRPGRTLSGVLLFFAFAGLTAYLTKGFGDPAVLTRSLAIAALLVFAPGRPLRAGARLLIYYAVAGLALTGMLLIPTFAAAENFSRALLPSILAAELITPLLFFPTKTSRES